MGYTYHFTCTWLCAYAFLQNILFSNDIVVSEISTLVVLDHFGPHIYQMGSLVITLVRPFVGPSLNISETANYFLLKLHEIWGQ